MLIVHCAMLDWPWNMFCMVGTSERKISTYVRIQAPANSAILLTF